MLELLALLVFFRTYHHYETPDIVRKNIVFTKEGKVKFLLFNTVFKKGDSLRRKSRQSAGDILK
jgi:hypothetical protein